MVGLVKAEQKFASDFTKAEVKGGCNVLGDAARVESDVDGCVVAGIDAPGGVRVADEICAAGGAAIAQAVDLGDPRGLDRLRPAPPASSAVRTCSSLDARVSIAC